jgi:Predicted integral membrane protein (DUF2269)
MDYYLLLGHIAGFILLGGGLLAVFVSELRAHTTDDVHVFAEAAWYTAIFYDALALPGALLVGLSGLLLIFELGLGFFEEPWLVGMWGPVPIRVRRGQHHHPHRVPPDAQAIAQGTGCGAPHARASKPGAEYPWTVHPFSRRASLCSHRLLRCDEARGLGSCDHRHSGRRRAGCRSNLRCPSIGASVVDRRRLPATNLTASSTPRRQPEGPPLDLSQQTRASVTSHCCCKQEQVMEFWHGLVGACSCALVAWMAKAGRQRSAA